jgi:hypothetical protein
MIGEATSCRIISGGGKGSELTLGNAFSNPLQQFGKSLFRSRASILNSSPGRSSSYDSGHNMGLGTKNRQRQTADICKQHLREKYCDKLALVEEFVVEIEGARKDCDVTRWGQFTDIKDIKQETLKRLELHFENWLNPGTQ